MMTSRVLFASAALLLGATLFAESKTESVRIEGMQCKVSCVGKVEKALSKVDGIEKADVKKGKAKISYDDEKTSHEEIVAAIQKAGFEVKKK